MLAVAFQLESARRSIEPADTTLGATLAAAVQDLQAALEDWSTTRGLVPATLERDGLRTALGDLAWPAVATSNSTRLGIRRLDPLVEATVWFVASEGLANVAKHAPGAPAKLILGLDNGILTVDVTDAGPGSAVAEGSAAEGVDEGAVGVVGGPESLLVSTLKCCLNRFGWPQLRCRHAGSVSRSFVGRRG